MLLNIKLQSCRVNYISVLHCYPFLFSSLFRIYQVLKIPVIQFLFVHNRGNLTSDTASGLSGSLIFSRLALIWRINFLLGSKLILKELLILKFIFKDSAILFSPVKLPCLIDVMI